MTDTEIKIFVAVCPIVISVFFSVLTTVIAQKLTHKNSVKKWVLEKRAEIYLDVYAKIETVLRNRTQVFNRDYLSELSEIKPQVKLLGSKEVVDTFKAYFLYIRKMNVAFAEFCAEHDPEQNSDNFEYCIDDDGEEYAIPHITEFDLNHFNALVQEYKRTNKPNVEEVNTYIYALNTAMRNDLGSNLK